MIKYPAISHSFSISRQRISPKILLSLFRQMLRIRKIELEIEGRYSLNDMKTPIHLVIGQEATYVGACAAMKRSDYVYCGHRTHGVYLAKGGDLNAMISEFYCKANGCAGSRGGSMHLLDPKVGMMGSSAICGGAIPIAAGFALRDKLSNSERVTTVFFGDGAAEEGVTWEILNFAALKKLPILFFCENNFYSVQTPLDKRQPDTDLVTKANSFGVPAVRIDGKNVLHVYQTCQRLLARIRRGEGPFFIEARVYRFRSHGGPGDDSHTGYRDVDERTSWEKYCPIETFYRFLLEINYLSQSDRKQMENEIELEIYKAFSWAASSPAPKEEEAYKNVYAD